MVLKRQVLEGRLDTQVKEWEASGAEQSNPEGAQFKEIKQAWRQTEDTRTRDFNERLPVKEQTVLLQAEDELHRSVAAFDGHDPNIVGVYLESAVPAF